jgi:hypothetical protein
MSMSDDTTGRRGDRERLQRGAHDTDRERSTLGEGARAHVTSAAVARPGAHTLSEAWPALEVETPGAFDTHLSTAREEIAALAEANAARDVHRSCAAVARIRRALDAAAHMLLLAQRSDDETVTARRAVLADLETSAAPMMNAAFTPSSAALDEVRASRTFGQWDVDVRVWQGTRDRNAMEQGADPVTPARATGQPKDIHDPRRIAARGVEGYGERLPFLDLIQPSFGRHDLSGIRAHVGGAAGQAARQLGARAFAFGNDIAFDGAPDLHTAAHEAAHVVQQRAGVALKGGIDQGNDAYEQHADATADKVVRGESAEPMLDQMAGLGAGAAPASPSVVQRKVDGGSTSNGPAPSGAQPMDVFRVPLGPTPDQAASSPAATAAHAPPRSVPRDATRIYLQTHSNAVWRMLRAHLHETSWQAATEQFTWRNRLAFTTHLVAALHDQVMAGAKAGDVNLAQLDALLYPANIEAELAPMLPIRDADDGRAMANRQWIPAVGLRISQLVHVALVPSVTRMTQRYVDATNARAEQAKREILRLDAKDLIASSPLDRIVARGLVIPGVAEVVPNGAIKPKGRTSLRPVRLAWQGAHDPSLWSWVRADLSDATVEEVAASLFGYAKDGSGEAPSYYSYGIAAAAPLFGLPATWAIQFPEARAHAPASVQHGAVPDEENDSIAARLATLAATDDADAIALRQSAGAPVDKAEPALVLAALDDSLIQLGALRATLVPWSLANEVVPVIVQVAAKRNQLRAAPAKDVRAYAAVAFGQRDRLVRIAGSITAAIAAASELSSSRGADNPVRPLLAMYARAAAAARLAETSETLIASAQDQQRALVLKSLQANQVASMQAMDEMRAGPAMLDPAASGPVPRTNSKGARDLSRPYLDVQDRARQLENTLLQGGEVDHDELQRVQLQQQEVALHARINNLTAQLQIIEDEAAAAGRGLAAKLASLGSSKFRSLGDASQAIRRELVLVRMDLVLDKRNPKPRSGDADGLTPPALDVSALRDALVKVQSRFTKLSDDRDLSTFLEGAYKVIKNQRLRTAIVNMVAMIGVSFAGSAIAGVAVKSLGRGMLAANSTGQIAKLSLAARGGLAAAHVMTEAVVQTAGQVALTGADPGAVFLENALMTVGLRGTQSVIAKDLGEARMFQKAFAQQVAKLEGLEAAALKQSSKLGAVARGLGREVLAISGETVMGMALGAVSNRVVAALEGKPHAATAGLGGMDALLQGASVAIGRLVHARVVERRGALEQLAGQSAGAKALQAHARQLEALAAKLIEHPDAQRALDVLGHQERLIREEIRVVDEMLARPDHGGYKADDLARTKAELTAQLGNARDTAMLGVKLHLSGLRELAPGTLWSGTPADIARGVAEIQATRPDAQVQQAGGITTVRVGDRVIEMHESVGPSGSGQMPTPDASAHPNAARSHDASRQPTSSARGPTAEGTGSQRQTGSAQHADRGGLPADVPANRAELRKAVADAFPGIVSKFERVPHTASDKFDALIAELESLQPGELGPTEDRERTAANKGRDKEILTKWAAINKEVEGATGHDQSELRELYNLAEQQLIGRWQESIKHLPREQQARTLHMYRAELRDYVRDLMIDDRSVQVLRLRDRAVSGDTRGPQFEALFQKGKKETGSAELAYEQIIGSSQRTNKHVNKAITGDEGGLKISRRTHPSDDHEYEFDALRPGPLSEESRYGDPKKTGAPVPAQGFYGGKYDQVTLTEDKVFYRVGDAERPWGQWWTDEPLKSEAQYRIDVAVKREWTDPATNTLPVGSARSQKQLELWSYSAIIPKGTKVYVGPVASQGGVHMGGPSTKQYFIPEAWKLDGKGGSIVEGRPFKRDGHKQPIPKPLQREK